ncbi:MAG: DUF134 domain-containing protein [Candidatus Aenigmarchaeota archaeon]|nr:DUF134 domain-containing protein [Candidatus Aenigmarchaeota archaeon]
MPRPRMCRRVMCEPGVTYFKPAGVRMSGMPDSVLTVDEFESIRLMDNEGLKQIEAAKKMKVSQPTFQRLYESARKKIADALVNGKAIRIEGGNYRLARRGGFMQGRGRMGGSAAGPSGECVCTKCGHKVPHQTGVPCYQMKCPECGAPMTRG